MLEKELFVLLERTADAAFAISADGEIQYWNKAAERLFGYPAEEVRNKTCHQILEGIGVLGTRVCHEGCSVMECAGNETEIPNFDMSVQTRSGQRLWINISTLVFENSRNARRLLIHLAHDISEQKKTEQLVEKMLDLSEQFRDLSESAVRAAPISSLSEQEISILRLFAAGKNSAEIAKSLHISLQTLRNHLHHVNQKLRTHNRLEAVMNAIHRKLI
jgi:PAS domain S-box-containing protein